MALPLLAKVGLGYLAFRVLSDGPPAGSAPGPGFGAPVKATLAGKSGRQYRTWTWSAPAYHFVAKDDRGRWLAVRVANGIRIPVGTNARGAEYDALKADWL